MCVYQFIQPLEEIREGGKEDLVHRHFEVLGKTTVPEVPWIETCYKADLSVMPLDIIHRNISSLHEYMGCLLQFVARGVGGYLTYSG